MPRLRFNIETDFTHQSRVGSLVLFFISLEALPNNSITSYSSLESLRLF